MIYRIYEILLHKIHIINGFYKIEHFEVNS